MKKTTIILLVLALLGSNSVVFAAPSEDKATLQAEMKEEREAKRAEMKEEREAKRAEMKEEREAKHAERVCERIARQTERVAEQTKEREEKALEQLEKRREQIQNRRNEIDERIKNKRADRDEQREKFYEKMLTKANTDEKIAALKEFEGVVEDAVSVRRDAVDVALGTYRSEIDALIDVRVELISGFYDEYLEKEAALVAEAEGICGDDATEEDLKNAAKEINEELKVLRESYKASVKEQRQAKDEVEEISQKRKDAVEAVIEAFRAVVDPARDELREAFELELEESEE